MSGPGASTRPGLRGVFAAAIVVVSALSAQTAAARQAAAPADAERIKLRWGEHIPLRDGVELNAAVYLPKDQTAPAPCIVTITPYTAQSSHATASYFAARGLPFVSVDGRGRGDSGGVFSILSQEPDDGADVVEWLAAQPYCNGRVAMWGGSYPGYIQWSTARRRPPHLAAIAPTASPFMGVDYPGRDNIRASAILWAGLYISGRANQINLLMDAPFWNGLFRDRFEAGAAFITLGNAVSDPARIPLPLAEWEAHPSIDAYWDRTVPSDAEFAAMDLPILSITGQFDTSQLGALEFYRRHTRLTSAATASSHYLIIGPWDHPGTRAPRPSLGGITVDSAGLVDIQALQLDWYRWVLSGGERPGFLKDRVAYYVLGAEQWRYAPSLDAVTAETRSLFLTSDGDANRLSGSGALALSPKTTGQADSYVYDPRDVSDAALESHLDPASLTDDRRTQSRDGRLLTYQSEPFAEDQELAGFFGLSAWLSIDQPDTDFVAQVHEVRADGSVILLASDYRRARYRESLRSEQLIETREPLLYRFDTFTFTARRIARGSRLRLTLGPVNSIHMQKIYNSGRPVSDETLADARPVTVRLFHDADPPSTLTIPLGQTRN